MQAGGDSDSAILAVEKESAEMKGNPLGSLALLFGIPGKADNGFMGAPVVQHSLAEAARGSLQ